jgi:hypothetical protein
MTATERPTGPGTDRRLFVALAWGVTLLVSLLPDILFREVSGSSPAWLFWAKVGIAAALLGLSLLWKRLRALWLFAAVVLAVLLLEWGVARFYLAVGPIHWPAGASSFVRSVGSVQLVRTTAAVLLVLVMWVLLRRFDRFFLVKGRLDAPAEPIPWILDKPPSWRTLGPAIAGAMCLGLLVFVFVLGTPPSLRSLPGLLPLLPFVLLFAASNAFGEEMLYRAPWLAALEGPVGPVHALLMTAAYFGIAHFYGVPYGVLGVVMAFIPGWLMGKAMLETRGFFWAWFIHFWMDVVIFSFMALGSVTPGG